MPRRQPLVVATSQNQVQQGIDQRLDTILTTIAEKSFEDYNRIGDAITNKTPIDVVAENSKIQHGSLVVKAVLARTAMAHVNK